MQKREHDQIVNNKVFIRPTNSIDICKLREKLLFTDWEKIKDNDINKYWYNLKSFLTDTANELCPLKKIKIKKDLPCWYLNDLAHLRYERDRLGTIYRKDKKKCNPQKKLQRSCKNF